MSITVTEQAVRIAPSGLFGDLVVPKRASAVVVFAHGSGSSRRSARNRYVADILQQGGSATLLLDLLTAAEEQVDSKTGHLRFDIDLLAGRLIEATEWLQQESRTRNLPMAYFGASTGAGAALVAAAERPSLIRAVVSRGGRPDLAGSALPRVQAPTLLIVGGNDEAVIRLNQQAMTALRVEKRLAIVPGATHLFEEPGALEEVAKLARGWFEEHLTGVRHGY
jgi:putative phosphoribosyl transferase